MVKELFRIQVPATCANLGPGYAVIGIAVTMFAQIMVSEEGSEPVVQVVGPGPQPHLDPRHDPLLRALHAASERFRIRIPLGLRFVVRNDIPPGAGLGTTTAAYAAGIATVARFAKKAPANDELVDLLVELGGDPAHGAAALCGGLTASCMIASPEEKPRYKVLPHALNAAWRFVIALPDAHVGAADARRVLPATLPHAATQRTVARLLVLLRALAEGDEELLASCVRDEVHVPFRRRLVPGMEEAMRAATDAGACAATITGHGPGLVAFTTESRQCEAIGRAMVSVFERAGIRARARSLEATTQGALA